MTNTHDAEALEARKQIVARIAGRDVTRGELADLFDRLVLATLGDAPLDRGSWKCPLDGELELDGWQVLALREAVIFFTGSVPTFRPLRRPTLHTRRYRVTAAGYYATVGA